MHPHEKRQLVQTAAAVAGVDAGKFHHALVVRPRGRADSKPLTVATTRPGFEQALTFIRQHGAVALGPALVGIEFAGHHGMTFAHFLAGLGYRIVTVLPSVTKRLKEVEDNSPRKDDAKDAAQICRLVGSGLFVSFMQLDETAAALRSLTTERERLTREETRLKNRLQSLLDLVWPEFQLHFRKIIQETPQALLARWVTPYELLAARPRPYTPSSRPPPAITLARGCQRAPRLGRRHRGPPRGARGPSERAPAPHGPLDSAQDADG